MIEVDCDSGTANASRPDVIYPVATLMQQFTIIAPLLCAIALVGCNSPSSNPAVDVKMLDGQPVNLLGRAVKLPNHTEKSNGIGVVTGQDRLLFVGDFRPFPAEVLGAQIRVKGVVRQEHLPCSTMSRVTNRSPKEFTFLQAPTSPKKASIT